MKEKLEYNKYKKLMDDYEVKVNLIASFRLIVFVVMIFSFILCNYYFEMFFKIVSIISFFMFILLIVIHEKYYRLYNYYVRYVEIISSYIDRENGKWRTFSDTGEDLIDKKKSFLEDLDILGNNSLYQYLSVCKTIGGRRNLLNKLSNIKFNNTKLREDQKAIEELVNNTSFDIEFQVSLAKYSGRNVDLSNSVENCSKNISFKYIFLLIPIICFCLSFMSLYLGLIKVISINYFYFVFIFNYLISFMYGYLFKEDFSLMDEIINSYGGLRDIFLVVVNRNFSSKKLNDISNNMKSGMKAVGSIKRLEGMNSIRSNVLANFISNGLSNYNVILMYYFKCFLSDSIDDLMIGVRGVEELEGMISVASMGIVLDNKCMPSISDKLEINVVNMKHPLFEQEKAVGNDFYTDFGVNIITGSNMGGKTSFLRTIGINIILMNAGGYVCADSFSSCYLKIFTSMRIRDDLVNGISTFYGELLRIKDAINYIDKGNMLVLIDEIFKGTNYQDRIYGAKEVIERLNIKNAICFITTHDFVLCDEKNVKNYYVKEYYENDEIKFDYKIREGKCSSTNAKYLMKKIGIIR